MENQLNRMPTLGDIVRCPEDRGEKPFQARITHVGTDVHLANQTRYVWVQVQRLNDTRGGYGNGGVWPSHRLGYKI